MGGGSFASSCRTEICTRSVREKEWLESLKTFGISAEDGKRIIYRLGHTLLSEHEKLFR
jgi:hypothetical protein